MFQGIVCGLVSISFLGPVIGFGGVGALAWLFQLEAPPPLDPGLHNHLRAVSVMFLCAGLMFAWSTIELKAGRVVFRVGVAMVLFAGLARMTGWLCDGYPGLIPVGLMVIELGVFPALFLWHRRLARVITEGP